VPRTQALQRPSKRANIYNGDARNKGLANILFPPRNKKKFLKLKKCNKRDEKNENLINLLASSESVYFPKKTATTCTSFHFLIFLLPRLTFFIILSITSHFSPQYYLSALCALFFTVMRFFHSPLDKSHKNHNLHTNMTMTRTWTCMKEGSHTFHVMS
jgi:hypothetical protein